MKIAIGFLAMLISVNAYASCCDNRVVFTNPYYNEGKHREEEQVVIPNGSCLVVAIDLATRGIIRAASALNDIPNPLGISHVSIVMCDSPRELMRFLRDEILPIFPKRQKELGKLKEEINRGKVKTDELTLFSIEAWPDIFRVNLLTKIMNDWPGNYYLRTPKKSICITRTRNFLKDVLFKPYESYLGLLRATQGKNEEELSSLFCSEMSSWFYKKLGLIDKGVNVSNVLPEQLSSGAGEYDLLKAIAEPEVVLRWERDFSADANGPAWMRAVLKPLSFLSSCVLF